MSALIPPTPSAETPLKIRHFVGRLYRVGFDTDFPPHRRLYLFEGTREECEDYLARRGAPAAPRISPPSPQPETQP